MDNGRQLVSIAHDFRSITRLIDTALGKSKLLLALYSTVYPQRPACQLELTLAYWPGRRATLDAELW